MQLDGMENPSDDWVVLMLIDKMTGSGMHHLGEDVPHIGLIRTDLPNVIDETVSVVGMGENR